MFWTRKKRRSNRRLLSHLCDFDRDVINNDAANSRPQDVVVIEGVVDREFAVDISGRNLAINDKTVNVQTWERCINESISREMGNLVDTVEGRI